MVKNLRLPGCPKPWLSLIGDQENLLHSSSLSIVPPRAADPAGFLVSVVLGHLSKRLVEAHPIRRPPLSYVCESYRVESPHLLS